MATVFTSSHLKKLMQLISCIKCEFKTFAYFYVNCRLHVLINVIICLCVSWKDYENECGQRLRRLSGLKNKRDILYIYIYVYCIFLLLDDSNVQSACGSGKLRKRTKDLQKINKEKFFKNSSFVLLEHAYEIFTEYSWKKLSVALVVVDRYFQTYICINTIHLHTYF